MELTEEQLQAKIDEATKELKAKNSDLISDIKAIKKTAKAFEGIDLDLLKSQAEELAKLKEASLTDAEKLAKQQEEQNKKFTETQQALLDAQAENLKMRKENAVSLAIIGAGQVNEGMDEAVNMLIASKVVVGENNIPMVGNKPVADYVKEFAEGEGKNFFVPKNYGGGGQGSGGSVVSTKEFEKADGSLNMTKIGQLRQGSQEDIARANDIVKAHSQKKD